MARRGRSFGIGATGRELKRNKGDVSIGRVSVGGSELRELIRLAAELGFRLERSTRRGHLIWRHWVSGRAVVTGSRFGDPRARKNALGMMRRYAGESGGEGSSE